MDQTRTRTATVRHGQRLGWVAAAALAGSAFAATQASATTYYVTPAGNDAGSGSISHPWRTLGRVRAAALAPGDRVLLHRGSSWTQALTIDRSGVAGQPITIATYGTGAAPLIHNSDCVKVKGSYVQVVGLAADRCTRAGFTVKGSHVTIRGVLASRSIAGVEVDDLADRARITRSRIVNNNRMNRNTPGGHDDNGAFGILLHGTNALVDHNLIRGSDAFSYDYGRDGSAVEIYGARGSTIYANLAIDNQAFTELGNATSSGTTYVANVVRSKLRTSAFLITQGPSGGYGPVRGTRVFHNTVVMTGTLGQGFVCSSGCSGSVLELRNNIIYARWKVGYADGPVNEDYDLLAGGKVQFGKGAHSLVAAPRFVAVTAGNLQLRAGSPAIGRGLPGLASRDFRGRVFSSSRPDIGAFAR